MKTHHFQVPVQAIEAFCRKWHVRELSLFGSVLREDFGAESDIDVLVSFGPGGAMTFEDYLEMQDELSAIFGGRRIDLVEKRFLRNPFRRHAILTTREVVYAR